MSVEGHDLSVQSREVQKASPFIIFCPLQQPAIPKPVKINIKINISNGLFDIMPIFNWISEYMGIAADAERGYREVAFPCLPGGPVLTRAASASCDCRR